MMMMRMMMRRRRSQFSLVLSYPTVLYSGNGALY
jgi:hypothetical protein